MKNKFDKFNLPKFPGYIVNKILQYSMTKKHFRTVKWIGKKYLILDNDHTELVSFDKMG